MAVQDDGDDFFSDTDLDALPHNALDELESNALLYTQHRTQATQIINAPPSSDYGDAFDDEDLDDAVVFDEEQAPPERLQPLIPLSGGTPTQREQFRKSRYGGPSNINLLTNRSLRQQDSPGQLPAPLDVPIQILRNGSLSEQHVVTGQAEEEAGVKALRFKVQELMRERDFLKQDITVKAGEIAIVRSKQEKAAKEFERELTALRKLNAEKLSIHQEATKAAKEAEKSAATEVVFLRRDLLEEAEKVRVLKRAKEKEKGAPQEIAATPRKNKSLAYRDGFDDDEIQIISPSKFIARRSNPGTPSKAGAKRKRKGQESPVVSLEIELAEIAQDDPDQFPSVTLNEIIVEKIRNPDDRLNFLEMVFDHRPHRNHLRTFEEFTKLAFPSAPAASFASIILGKLPTLSSNKTPVDFPIEFCELIISLWNKCLSEQYHKPVYLLTDLLSFCLELKTLVIAPFIIDSLLPVAQKTAELIAIPRFTRQSYTQFEKDIDVTSCLAIIHLAALGCMNEKAHITRFWRAMRLDFVLMILSQHQAIEDFIVMLQLLSMSTTKDSVGPITPESDTDVQLDQAGYIIDRVSLQLINLPVTLDGSTTPEDALLNLHIQILRTLEAFCQHSLAGAAIATHPSAIGRIVKLMCDGLDSLYDYQSGHKQRVQIVSLAARLLHHLTTKHERLINMQDKLSRIHGGTQKYLICLARLHFSEDDLVLDAGIGPEIQECAHEMLELFVTPDEGDAIHSAFSSNG